MSNLMNDYNGYNRDKYEYSLTLYPIKPVQLKDTFTLDEYKELLKLKFLRKGDNNGQKK